MKSDSEMLTDVNNTNSLDLNVHRDEVLRLVSDLHVVMFAKQSEQGLLRYEKTNMFYLIIFNRFNLMILY